VTDTAAPISPRSAKLRSNPLVILTGFSGLVGRATVERNGRTLALHVDATEVEAVRLLELLASQLAVLAGSAGP